MGESLTVMKKSAASLAPWAAFTIAVLALLMQMSGERSMGLYKLDQQADQISALAVSDKTIGELIIMVRAENAREIAALNVKIEGIATDAKWMRQQIEQELKNQPRGGISIGR
mgnify:CR=1 FL=1